MRTKLILAMLLIQAGCATGMPAPAWVTRPPETWDLEERRQAAVALGRPLVPDTLPDDHASNYFLGVRHGEMAATWHDTEGRVGGGALAGLTLGLIGAGIVYVIADSDEVRIPQSGFVPPAVFAQQNEYTAGFRQSYSERVRSARKSKALRGGLIGTAFGAGIIIMVLANN